MILNSDVEHKMIVACVVDPFFVYINFILREKLLDCPVTVTGEVAAY